MQQHLRQHLCLVEVVQGHLVLLVMAVARCRTEGLQLVAALRPLAPSLMHRRVSGVSVFMVAVAVVMVALAVTVVEVARVLVVVLLVVLVVLVVEVARVVLLVVLVALVVEVARVMVLVVATAAKASPILNFMQIWECEYVSN